MNHSLLFGGLLALLATGCQPASAPDATAPSGPGPHLTQNNVGTTAQHDQVAAEPAALATTAADQGPRAQAMRLHDDAMSRLDALAAERQRLAGALARLGAAPPADPRRGRPRTGRRADDGSARHAGAQVAACWQQQLPVLRQIDQRTTAALDSARVLR